MNALAAIRPEGRQGLAVLTEMSAALAHAGLDLPVLLDTITGLLASHVGDVGMIYLLDDDGVTLEMASLSSTEDLMFEFVSAVLGDRPRRIDDPGPIATCVDTRQPAYVDGIDQAALRALLPDEYNSIVDQFPPYGSYYLYYVPLIADGEIVGILFVSSYLDSGGISEADRDLVCDIAELTAPAVVNARLHTRLAEMTAVFEAAFEHAPIGMAIHTAGPGPSRFVKVNRSLALLLGVDRESVIGVPLTDFLPVEARAEVAELDRRFRAGERSEYGDTRRMTRADGVALEVRIDSRAIRTPEGTLLILSQARDPRAATAPPESDVGPRP